MLMNIRLNHFWATIAAAAAVGATTLGAVASPSAVPPAAPPTARPVPSANIGEIVNIDPIRTRPQGSGVGAVAGGVVGGVLGHELLGGTAATAIGAVGGAVAGNNLERNHREGVAGYHVTVRLESGGTRTLTQTHVGGLRIGDRVRVQGGRIQRV
jgi:outer membrane lipoprotein SlyB